MQICSTARDLPSLHAGSAALSSFPLKLIGVTGANGKTTTSCLIASILATAGYRVGLMSTLGCFDGEGVEPLPPAPGGAIAPWMARMVSNGCTHAVLEMNDHALARSGLTAPPLNAVCVTNVGRDHLRGDVTFSDYRPTRAKWFDHLAPGGFAVVNADDKIAADCLRGFGGPALTVAIHGDAEIIATPVERFLSEQTFLLTAGSQTLPVRTRMIGTHHIYNCLTAAAVGLAYGIDLTAVVRGLESVDYVPGRLERIECGQPFGVFIDLARKAEALVACLQVLRPLTAGRLICVFGPGDVAEEDRPRLGRLVAQAADLAVVTSDDPRQRAPWAVLQQILAGLDSSRGARAVSDRRQAVHGALSEAQPGDCLLIAGKYDDADLEVEETLDDRETAVQWLSESDDEPWNQGDCPDGQ